MLIAGLIEEGESAEEAAVREVAEETGLSVELDAILGTYPSRDGDRQLLMIAMVASADSTELILNEELTDAAWYEIDDLPDWPSEWPLKAVFDEYRQLAQRMQGDGRGS